MFLFSLLISFYFFRLQGFIITADFYGNFISIIFVLVIGGLDETLNKNTNHYFCFCSSQVKGINLN